MTRSQLATRMWTVLMVVAALSGGVMAQEASGEADVPVAQDQDRGQDQDQAAVPVTDDAVAVEAEVAADDLLEADDSGRHYSDITITPDEAYLDLRADSSAAMRLLGETLDARGEKLPRGAMPETWFKVGDAWMRVEPLPYMRGAWSRVRLRVGTFETDAEQHRAEELLSALAFRLDEELGGVSVDDSEGTEPQGAWGADGEFPYPQSIAGGHRAGGATELGLAVDAAAGAAGQQPIQVSVPVEINTVTYDNGYDSYDDGYGYGYGGNSYYGGYAYTPYAYCSPWAYSWLSYCSWHYGYQYGWHGYSSYYAWCSPYSGWGWYPYGWGWSGWHEPNCGCNACSSVPYYASTSDDDAGTNGGDGDSDGGGVGTNGGLGGNGGGQFAGESGAGTLPSAATPLMTRASSDVLGFEPRVAGIDPGDGPQRRGADGLSGSPPLSTPGTTPGPQGTGTLATPADDITPGGPVVRTVAPTRPPSNGGAAWSPTVRTVSARTVRVGSPSAEGDVRPSVRASLPTRSLSSDAGSWSSSDSSGSRAVRTLTFSSAPVIRTSTPSVVSRVVSGSSSRGRSSSVSSLTEQGTVRAVPTPVVSTSIRSLGGRTSSFPTTVTPTYTTSPGSSISSRSRSGSLPTFNRSSPIPSRGTSLTPSRSSSRSRGSTSAGRLTPTRSSSVGTRGRSSSSSGRSSAGASRSGRGR